MMISMAMATTRISKLAIWALLASAWTVTALAAAAPHAASSPPAATTPAPAPGTLLDEVVAIVNDQPILKSALDEELASVSASLQAQGTPIPPENVFRHQVLEHLITQSLELQAADNQGIQVSDDQINQALSEIAQRNNVSLAQLPQALAAQGQNYATFRSMIRDQLIIHQLAQQVVASNIEVSPAEISQYLQNQKRGESANVEYHVAQILVAFPSNPSPEQAQATLTKAQTIETKLKGGADFAATAVAESAGPHALQGGDIGWLKGADLPTFFADVVPGMKPGEISNPIAGAGGYHIVKLVATRKPEPRNLKTEYDVEHILIRPNPVRDLDQAKALAEKLRGEIVSGKIGFAVAAKQYSDDPNSAGNGGSLGWGTLDALPKPLAQTVADLPLNTLSQPVQTQYGWHLVEVTGKRRNDVSQAERENEAYQAIFQRKLTDQLAEFTRTLRGQAYIRILYPADAGNDSSSETTTAGGD